jgi:hypothetical protein
MNFGALAGGIGLGYERAERLRMDDERAKQEKEMRDLQITGLRRNESEAAKRAAIEDEIKAEGMKYYNEKIPQAQTPDYPVNDDQGVPYSQEMMPPGIQKQAAPQPSEWDQKSATVGAIKRMADVALKRGDLGLYDKYSKHHAEANAAYANERAQDLYRRWNSAKSDSEKGKIVEDVAALYNGNYHDGVNTLKVENALDEKGNRTWNVALNNGKTVSLSDSQIPDAIIQIGNPSKAMELSMSRAAAQRDAALKEREVGAKEKTATAAQQRADAQDDYNRIRDKVGDARVGLLNAKASGSVGGAGGRDPSRIREARALVEEGVYDNFEEAYNATRKSNREDGERMRWIGQAMNRKDAAGRPIYKTEADAAAAYDRTKGGGAPGIKPTGTPAAPGATAGWSAVQVPTSR